MARVVTHDGAFHADEVVAVAILLELNKLRRLCGEPPIVEEIVRTRDMKRLMDGDLVVDVGGRLGVCELEGGGRVHFLDHHQRGGAGVRDNGLTYAAAGLVWKTVGPELLKRSYPALRFVSRERIWGQVDRFFIAPIDAVDNGFDLSHGWVSEVRTLTFSTVIASMNSQWYESSITSDEVFHTAVDYALVALENAIKRSYGSLLAVSRIEAALKSRADRRLLVLEQFCPWDSLSELPGGQEVIFVVFPETGGRKWLVRDVPGPPGSAIRSKKYLPAAWSGLENEALQAVTGVQDALFCHAGLFICGANSKEGALRLAQLALAN